LPQGDFEIRVLRQGGQAVRVPTNDAASAAGESELEAKVCIGPDSPGRISSGLSQFSWTLQGLSLPRIFPTRILPTCILRRYRDKAGEILKQDRITLRPDDALRCPLTQQPAYCEQRGSGHLR